MDAVVKPRIRKDEPPRMEWVPEPGFFRFLEPCARGDMLILERWESWFHSRGIKTLRKSCKHKGYEWFVLFRADYKPKKPPVEVRKDEKQAGRIGVQ